MSTQFTPDSRSQDMPAHHSPKLKQVNDKAHAAVEQALTSKVGTTGTVVTRIFALFVVLLVVITAAIVIGVMVASTRN